MVLAFLCCWIALYKYMMMLFKAFVHLLCTIRFIDVNKSGNIDASGAGAIADVGLK